MKGKGGGGDGLDYSQNTYDDVINHYLDVV